jgi:hypothetical protein
VLYDPPCCSVPRPSTFIEPCLPSSAERPPSGPGWIHEIKHDGYHLMARRDPVGIRLLTRNGYDWAPRYPLIVEAVNMLKVRSCLIDGEAVACDDNGVAVFERLRRKREGQRVFLYAFDLLELDGKDLRREPAHRGAQGDTRQRPAGRPPPACGSISISQTPVTSFSVTPAPWDSKASSASALGRATRLVGPAIG